MSQVKKGTSIYSNRIENRKIIEGETANFFCQTCLKIPEYSILIDQQGNINLSHLCLNNKVINIDLSKQEIFQSKTNNKVCVHCQTRATNICLKCDEFICDNCISNHETTIDLLNTHYSQYSIFPIIDSQYYCKQHLKRVTHFCRYCKVNLCEKECREEHFHYKNELLNSKININPSGYNGDNSTLKNLAKLSRDFHECYKEGLKNSKLTINIILNTYLIEPINSLIKKYKQTKVIIKDMNINNNFKKAEEEQTYMFNFFGDNNFNEYYFRLIINAQQGNIRSYHNLIKIKNRYISLNKCKKEIFSIKQNYLILLTLSIEKCLDDLALLSNLKEFGNLPLVILDVKKKINKLQNVQNELELDLELIKKYIISIDNRVDFELRRKVGNIIGNKLLNIFGERIDKIPMTQYLLTLSIEDIEKKIVDANRTIINENDKKNELTTLKEKYKKALELMKQITSEKFNNSNNVKNIKFPKLNISYKFISNTKDQKNIQDDTILNLFFIIKNQLSDAFNNSIHNETVKLNYLAIKELEKYKSELKSKEEEFKNQIVINNDKENEHNIFEKENENYVKGKEDFSNNKNKENRKKEPIKICKENKIIYIKQNFSIADDTIEKGKISINNILIEKNDINIESFLFDFYQKLKEKETLVFDVIPEVNIESAIDLYYQGEKSQIMIPLNKEKKNRARENEEKKRIKDILDCSNNSKPLQEIIDDLDWINSIIDKNLKRIENLQKRSIDYIEDYGEFFNIESIINQFKLSVPLDYYEISDIFRNLKRSSVDTALFEKCFYM